MNEKSFCVFILTHGRPNKIYTLKSLKRSNYTGDIFFIVDDEDPTRFEYIEKYGDKVKIFSKDKIAKTFDEADNFKGRGSIVYARNACFGIAEELGYKYFIQLDDDYTDFRYKYNDKNEYGDWTIKNLDNIFDILLEYYKTIPALSIAVAQGGDFIGGKYGGLATNKKLKRKCMNTFICSTDRKFIFNGKINEDVNTYTSLASRGGLFLTIPDLAIQQMQTQSNDGGMTEIYLDGGTYIKSFYSVIFSPSCVVVAEMGSIYKRLHHRVNWNNAVPLIVEEKLKK